MDNEVMVRQETGIEQAATASEIVARVQRMQDVVKRVMKEGEHFGIIPGCKKKSLYSPGAELLTMTFGVAAQVERVEDLSTPDEIRYRVTVAGLSRSGVFLGNHAGECSSSEEKYKWRRPVCNEEFDETPEDRRREVWKHNSYKNKSEKIKQVRTNPSDVANTILAMAEKRGFVGMVRKVTGASSMFTDGIEDLPPGMVEPEKEAITMPQERKADPPPTEPPAGSDENDMAGVIKTVTRKSGEKAGKKYTRFGVLLITDAGETWLNTFDTTLGESAEKFKGRMVQAVVKKTQYGFDLLDMSEPVDQPPEKAPF